MIRVIFIVILLIIFIPRILANIPGGAKRKSGKLYDFTTPANVYNYDMFTDVLNQPHCLIAGCQGSGKSVVINGLIDTVLHRLPFDRAGGAQLVLIDPKRVELAAYSKMPHTLTHAAGFNPSAWLDALKQAVSIMDDRYTYMEKKGLKKYDKGDLYVVIDEWANVFKNGGKDAYKMVLRLTSEGRAARVHLIMATQVPKANIIPTEIRENFDARICLRTANAIQSRVIMENDGCESLPRYGQGFYVKPEGTVLYNIPYVKDDEIAKDIAWWNDQMEKNR